MYVCYAYVACYHMRTILQNLFKPTYQVHTYVSIYACTG